MKELTFDWIISTLKKSGINSKQVVINKLETCKWDELIRLSMDLKKQAIKRIDITETSFKLDPRD